MRHTPRATLLTTLYVLVIAALLALTTTNLLAGTLAPLTAAPPSADAASRVNGAAPVSTEGFSHHWTTPAVAAPTGGGEVVTPPQPPQPEPFVVELKLIGTFVGTDSDALSSAMLRDPTSGQTFTLGVGERIRDDARVVRIEHGAVVLERDDAARLVLPISG